MSSAFCCFSVVTPVLVVSAGSWLNAPFTRFCTFTAAMSALAPCLKYMLIDASPVFEAVEVI